MPYLDDMFPGLTSAPLIWRAASKRSEDHSYIAVDAGRHQTRIDRTPSAQPKRGCDGSTEGAVDDVADGRRHRGVWDERHLSGWFEFAIGCLIAQ